MNDKYIPRENLNRSLVASLNIEGLNPSKEAINLADLVIDGVTSKDEAIAQICSKYTVKGNTV
ncbi:MAG: antitoxin VbhA family protein [Ruminococcus sp.]|nr:antitoxin VbhA family protein [Ruminococcus sp.]